MTISILNPIAPVDAKSSKASLKTRFQNVISGKSGLFSVGIENLKTGEKVYLNPGRMRAASVIKVFVMMAAFKKASELRFSVIFAIYVFCDAK